MTGNFGSTNFRPLLPNAQAWTPVPKRRSVVKAACEACRRRKAKCDAKRPSCSACVKGGRECEYRTGPSESRTTVLSRERRELKRKLDELQDSHNVFDQVFQAIQSRPETEAVAIFQRIREGADCDSIMRHISAGDILLQLHVTPETRYRYAFPYRTRMPTSLLAPNNPYLHSLVYEAAFSTPEQKALPSPADEKYRAQYFRPLLAAEIVDPRLDSVKPSRWTNVSNDDDLMKQILRAYLLSEYSWWTFFHKDHFLDDMVRGSDRFCSPLLVNAVLAFACHCHRGIPDRSEFWNPQSLAYKFSAEAKRLWELEQTAKSSLTALQAAMIIGLRYDICGMDKIGLTYLRQAVDMATDLKLFDQSTYIKSDRMRHSRNFTAWCLFNWQSSRCYLLFSEPLIKEPPKMTLPDPEKNPAWYGEFWIKYPLNQMLYPVDYCYLFKANSDFCVILNRVSLKFFGEGGNSAQSSRKTVAGFVGDLTAWYFSLPDPLTPKRIVFPSQIKLHLQHYNVMLNLWELLVAEADPILEPSIHEGLAHSKMCFETLLRLYYLRHGFEAMDVFIIHCLQVLSFMSVATLKTLPSSSTASFLAAAADDVRATLILTAKGLCDQGRNYYLSETIYYVVESRLSPEDAELMRKFVHIRKEDSEARHQRARHLQSQILVDVVKITEHPENKSLSNLINQYADMALEPTSPAESSDSKSSP